MVEVADKRLRIVVADDDKRMRETMIRLLEPEFAVVSVVADGVALVAAVDQLEPDIGIVDISMPLLNGILAATEIKRRGSKTKIVFLTVNEDRDFVRAAFESGASAYVSKRRMALDLCAALKETLEGRKFVSPGCELPGSTETHE